MKKIGKMMLFLVFLVAFFSLFIPIVIGQTAITECMDITTEGSYELTQDITNETLFAPCINIKVSNVTIDGQGYTIHTTQANPDGRGIRTNNNNYNLSFFNFNLNNTGGGITIDASNENILFENITIINATNKGINIRGNSYNVSLKNIFINTTADTNGIDIDPNSHNITIENLTVQVRDFQSQVNPAFLSQFSNITLITPLDFRPFRIENGHVTFQDADGIVEYPFVYPSFARDNINKNIDIIDNVISLNTSLFNYPSNLTFLFSTSVGTAGAVSRNDVLCTVCDDLYTIVDGLEFNVYVNNETSPQEVSNFSLLLGGAPLIDQELTANSTFDTDLESFFVNMSVGGTPVSAFGFLNYNGTVYPTLDDEIIIVNNSVSFNKSIDIPVVDASQNHSYFWEIFITNSTADVLFINSTGGNQTVNPSDFGECTGATIEEAVNYTIFDESDRTPIEGDLHITFEWFLGSGTVRKNSSFHSVDDTSHIFCINANQTFFTNVITDVHHTPGTPPANINYHNIQYDFLLEPYSNDTTIQLLGLTNNTIGSDIIIKVKDTGAIPLEGWMVQIYKFFPEINEWWTIGSRLTDAFGQFEQTLIEKDVRYRFQFYDTERTLQQTEEGVAACEITICFIEFIIEDVNDPFEVFDDIENYQASLTFNEDTNTYIFTWSDGTNEGAIQRLFVERYAFNESSVVCNVTSSNIVGSLSCGVGNGTYSYIAQGFRYLSGDELRVALLTVKVGDISLTFNLEGLFWGFILLFTLVAIGIWNPPVGIVLYLVGYMLLGFLGVIYMHPAIFFAQLIIGVLFIWAFKT